VRQFQPLLIQSERQERFLQRGEEAGGRDIVEGREKKTPAALFHRLLKGKWKPPANLVLMVVAKEAWESLDWGRVAGGGKKR